MRMSRHWATGCRLLRASIQLAMVRLVGESAGVLHCRALKVRWTHHYHRGGKTSEASDNHRGRLARDHEPYVFFQESIDIRSFGLQKFEGFYSRSNESVVSTDDDSAVHLTLAEQYHPKEANREDRSPIQSCEHECYLSGGLSQAASCRQV